MEHSFSIEIAEIVGVEKAIILKHFDFWLTKNKANNKNFFDGKYWTYNTAEALSVLFPYFSPKKVWRLLTSLEDDGILISGNYNSTNYDRTKWYSFGNAFPEKWKSIFHFWKMEIPKMENPFSENETPIPDNKTNEKPNKKPNKEARIKKRATPDYEWKGKIQVFEHHVSALEYPALRWSGKEIGSLKNLSKSVDLLFEKNNEIARGAPALDMWLCGVRALKDKYFVEHHFTPSGLVSMFNKINQSIFSQQAKTLDIEKAAEDVKRQMAAKM